MIVANPGMCGTTHGCDVAHLEKHFPICCLKWQHPSNSLEVGLHKSLLLDSLLRVSLESELFKRFVIGELHQRQGVRGATRREKKT